MPRLQTRFSRYGQVHMSVRENLIFGEREGAGEMAGNYPEGITDMDEHFDLPNAGDDKPELYGLRLDTYDGQPMHMDVFEGKSRLALSLEEIRDAHRVYRERNPKGRYSIVPLTEANKHGRDTEHDHCWHHRPEAPSLCCVCEDVTEMHAEMRRAELDRLGITEEEIEETRYPTCWPA